jgi:hypothetical protein
VFVEFYNAGTVGALTPMPSDGSGLAVLHIEPTRQSWLQAITPFFASLAVQSAYAALFSLWPAHIRNQPNDGALIAQSLRTKSEANNPYAWANAILREGVSPRHWPAWIVAALRDAMASDKPPSGAAMLALFHAMDSKPMDAAGARRALECFKAGDAWADDGPRSWLCAWDAIVAALLENDAKRAELLYRQINQERFASTADTLAAKAAIAARRHDPHAMREALAEFDRVLAREPMRASAWRRLAHAIRESAR